MNGKFFLMIIAIPLEYEENTMRSPFAGKRGSMSLVKVRFLKHGNVNMMPIKV